MGLLLQAGAASMSIAAAAGLATLGGRLRWGSRTRALHRRLEAARRDVEPYRIDPAELDTLPPPVRRYLQTVLPPDARRIDAADLGHHGTFRFGEAGWKPFTSRQRVVMAEPGFDWDAEIRLWPGVGVRVHDAYVQGEGVLHASLLGLAPLAEAQGRPDVAEGELMRWLAEAPLYPTALLPSSCGVRWTAVDASSADAMIEDRGIRVRLRFIFGPQGLVTRVYGWRGRLVGDTTVPTPWEGRWTAWSMVDGFTVPVEGEVAWLLPGGPEPYWRGQLDHLRFEWAGTHPAFASPPVLLLEPA